MLSNSYLPKTAEKALLLQEAFSLVIIDNKIIYRPFEFSEKPKSLFVHFRIIDFFMNLTQLSPGFSDEISVLHSSKIRDSDARFIDFLVGLIFHQVSQIMLFELIINKSKNGNRISNNNFLLFLTISLYKFITKFTSAFFQFLEVSPQCLSPQSFPGRL